MASSSDSIWTAYEKREKIGEGVYGKVYMAIRRADQMPVAIKKTKLAENSGPEGTTIRELVALKSLAGLPFIATLVEKKSALRLFDTEMTRNALYLVMEYGPRDLHAHIKDTRGAGLELDQIKHFTMQLLVASYHLQIMKIMHRDLKPNNILVTRDRNTNEMIVKMIDFGLARSYTMPTKPYSPQVQTVLYRAPELFFQNNIDEKEPIKARVYGAKVDTWSIGCIMGGTSEIAVKSAIVRMRGAPAPGDFDFVMTEDVNYDGPGSVPLCDTLRRMTDPDGLNLIDLMLQLSPKKRIHTIAALTHRYFDDIYHRYKEYIDM
ncbi:hypothetical protein HDU67_001308 [Dinochytrium kinnereticum]|nr:hypothetical protein HDU67_001308 [Dinochytrium kinnereticum]